MSFMGGGSSSQTATQAPGSANPTREESKSSSFKAFGGKGTSLGSASATSTRPSSSASVAQESTQSRNLAAVSAIVQQREAQKAAQRAEAELNNETAAIEN